MVWFGATHYDPVRANHGGVPSTVRLQSGQPTRLDTLEPSSKARRPFVSFGVPYRDGQWFEYGFTLVNDSPFTVRIDQIGSARASDPLRPQFILVNAPSTEPAWGPGAPTAMVPFHPFDLAPHSPRYVLVRMQFYGCSLRSSEEFVILAGQLVHLRIDFGLWSVSRSVILPLPYTVKIAGRDGCPP
jgi:hypothetical protein